MRVTMGEEHGMVDRSFRRGWAEEMHSACQEA